MLSTDDALERFLSAIRKARRPTRPTIVALDGRSGAGKSTFAAAAQRKLKSCVVIEGDTFYAGGTDESWDELDAAAKVAEVIDWRAQRPVIEVLRDREAASWHGFDWEAFDGRLKKTPIRCGPADVVILEGAYSARPELADLFDLRVLLATPHDLARERLLEREGDRYRSEWEARWTEAELHYFGSTMPPEAFDLVL